MKRKVAQQARELLAKYGNCELLVIGINEIGLLGGKDEWWNCELFQIGLKEIGLA
jgi:hypothetical protein